MVYAAPSASSRWGLTPAFAWHFCMSRLPRCLRPPQISGARLRQNPLGALHRKALVLKTLNLKAPCRTSINPNRSPSSRYPPTPSKCRGSASNPSRSSRLPSVRPSGSNCDSFRVAEATCPANQLLNSEAVLALLRCRYVTMRSSPDDTVSSTSIPPRADPD